MYRKTAGARKKSATKLNEHLSYKTCGLDTSPNGYFTRNFDFVQFSSSQAGNFYTKQGRSARVRMASPAALLCLASALPRTSALPSIREFVLPRRLQAKHPGRKQFDNQSNQSNAGKFLATTPKYRYNKRMEVFPWHKIRS